MIVAFKMPRLLRLDVVQARQCFLSGDHAPGFNIRGDRPSQLSEAKQSPICLPCSSPSIRIRLLAEMLNDRINRGVCLDSNQVGNLLSFLQAGKGVGLMIWPDLCADVAARSLVSASGRPPRERDVAHFDLAWEKSWKEHRRRDPKAPFRF